MAILLNLVKLPGNTGMNYEMGGTILSKTGKEKDLGVSMNANMKVSEQCKIAASKQGSTLAVFRYPEHLRFSDGIPDSLAQ